MTKDTKNKRRIFKLVVVGETEVGKTSLVSRWVKGVFPEFNKIKTTIGVAFATKKLELTSDSDVTLQIWDFAGQSRFTPLIHEFIKGAKLGFLVFDLTNLSTLDVIENFWFKQFKELLKLDFTKPTDQYILIGNKLDLIKDSPMFGYVEKQTKIFAERYNLPYLLLSAKSGENIDALESRVKSAVLKLLN
ncbi:MAG: Rab family GTPase [Candidatus Odinarchaeia archaeon]